jgi:hypothetical protein
LPSSPGACALRSGAGSCPRAGAGAWGFGVCAGLRASVDRCPIAFLFCGLGLLWVLPLGRLVFSRWCPLHHLDKPRNRLEAVECSPGSGRRLACWSTGTTPTSAVVHLQVSRFHLKESTASPQREHRFTSKRAPLHLKVSTASPPGEHPFAPWKQCLTSTQDVLRATQSTDSEGEPRPRTTRQPPTINAGAPNLAHTEIRGTCTGPRARACTGTRSAGSWARRQTNRRAKRARHQTEGQQDKPD